MLDNQQKLRDLIRSVKEQAQLQKWAEKGSEPNSAVAQRTDTAGESN